jgi:hypothetical protein
MDIDTIDDQRHLSDSDINYFLSKAQYMKPKHFPRALHHSMTSENTENKCTVNKI